MGLLFSVVPTLLFWTRESLGNGMDFVWFSVLYCVGNFIKKHGFANQYNSIILYFVFPMITFLSKILIPMVTKQIIGREALGNVLFSYNSITVFCASIALFLFFLQLDNVPLIFKKISQAGHLCIGAYLLTDHPVIRDSLWAKINIEQYHGISLIVAVLCLSFQILSVGCLVESVRLKLMNVTRFDRYINTFCERIDARVEVH